jgi:hypothetical protein
MQRAASFVLNSAAEFRAPVVRSSCGHFGLWRFQWGRGPRRRSAASVTDLPLGPVEIPMLIVARGCVEQYSCRFTHFAASAVSTAVVWAAQSRSIRASCSARRSHTQTPAPSALAARLFPHSPPNPTFALLAEYRGLPVSRMAEHLPRRADLECRCIDPHAASQARQSAGESPSDRSLRGERRRSDGKATTLRSSRADLAAFWAYRALGTSLRRWGCAGRSHPSHSTSRSPPTSWERGAWIEQVAPIQPQAGIGRALVWACFVRRKFSPHLAYSDRKRASGCSHATSKHRAASAGLLATAGEPASCMFLMPCILDARVPQAAAGLLPERRFRWRVRASPW